jgi:hypothetical protein
LGLLAAAAGFSLSGCGSIDNMLFGGTEQAAQPPANAGGNGQEAAQTAAPPPASAQSETAPPATAPAGAPPPPSPATAPPPAPVASAPLPAPTIAGEFAPVPIAPGQPTGTTVSHTIDTLRSQLEALEAKLVSGAQNFADLENTDTQQSTSYEQIASQIAARLAAGTTRGNPELIGQWNSAQGALDSMTGNINALAALAHQVETDSRAAHDELNAIQSAFDESGAVDEDHRQLTLLSDEANETAVQIDRLLREVKQALERQTAYVANERGNLVRLASAIKAGEYSLLLSGAPAPMRPHRMRAAAAETPAPDAPVDAGVTPPTGTPIVTIKFDHPHVSYETELYSALSQALATQPAASFDVVGVAPSGGGASGAAHDARAVMHAMGEMGVPASRMSVSAATDSAISSSEVRVYVK